MKNRDGATIYFKMMECIYLKELHKIEFVDILNRDDIFKNKLKTINIYKLLFVKWMLNYNYLSNKVI